MQTYDILMLVVLVGATIFGAWKGLAWQLASLGAIVASYFVALEFRSAVAPFIHTDPPWNVFLAMLILYVGTSFVIWVAFRLISGFIDRLRLKEFDRQVGALFGLAKGVLLCVIITLFSVTLLNEQRQAIIESRSGRVIALLLDRAHAVMPQELHEVLHPYIHPFDGRHRPGEHPPLWQSSTITEVAPSSEAIPGVAGPAAPSQLATEEVEVAHEELGEDVDQPNPLRR